MTIATWSGPIAVDRLKGKKITINPILQAGLGMMDWVLRALPSTKVLVAGLYRDGKTLNHLTYFENFGQECR
jgi:uracil phosphoribosyltransferase